MIDCKFSTVRERDMDLMFLELFASDEDFCKLFLEKTDLNIKDFQINKVELSRTELDLGESDITVILKDEKNTIALLIEDKVDAIAMNDQHLRYHKRGEKGIQNKEYDDFRIFIVCPKKYHSVNEEAKLYEHFVSYEECLNYLREKEDLLSNIRCQQLEQAIIRAKKPAEVTLNEAANNFFRKYKEYQQTHYPELDLRTKESSNGWWAHYATRFGKTYIYHKMQEGFVDLTFPNGAVKMNILEDMASWLRLHNCSEIMAQRTGNAGSLRILVPKLEMKKEFSYTAEEDIQKCFKAISELATLTEFLEKSRDVRLIKK